MSETVLRDADIREPLFDFLEEKYGKIRVIEEKTMGRSRADVLMITEDGITGIEIKSDADTYTRLAGQVKDYDLNFDRNMVVVGTKHAMHIEEHVPDYWGIITCEEGDGTPDFYILREPKANPKKDMHRKIRILWRPELAHIQERNQLPAYRQKSKKFVADKLCEALLQEVLDREISAELFERDYNTIEETLNAFRKEAGRPGRKRKRVRRRR